MLPAFKWETFPCPDLIKHIHAPYMQLTCFFFPFPFLTGELQTQLDDDDAAPPTISPKPILQVLTNDGYYLLRLDQVYFKVTQGCYFTSDFSILQGLIWHTLATGYCTSSHYFLSLYSIHSLLDLILVWLVVTLYLAEYPFPLSFRHSIRYRSLTVPLLALLDSLFHSTRHYSLSDTILLLNTKNIQDLGLWPLWRLSSFPCEPLTTACYSHSW